MQTSQIFEFAPIFVSIYLMLFPKIFIKYGESRIKSRFQRLNLDNNIIKHVLNVAFDWDSFIGYLGAAISLIFGSILLVLSGSTLSHLKALLCFLILSICILMILMLFIWMEKNHPLSSKSKCLGLTYANFMDITLWISNIILGILTYLNIGSRV